MENNESYKIAGINKVRIKICDETVRALRLVRRDPSLNKNFIPLSTFDLK